MSLSVVMPVYNVAPFVVSAVESVLAQTYRDFDLVVVDDGSTDATAERVAAIADPRVRLIRSTHVGCAVATSQAIAATSGDLVGFVDGDDLVLPAAFEHLVEILGDDPKVGAAAAWSRRFGGSQFFHQPPTEPNAIRRRLRTECAFTKPVIVRRTALEAVGGLRPIPSAMEDWDLWIRLAARFDIRIVPDCLALIRSRSDSAYWSEERVESRRTKQQMRRTALRELGADPCSLLTFVKGEVTAAALRFVDRKVPRRTPRMPEIDAPEASVVVTTYRRPELLRRCLAGVNEQRPAPKEVIVVHRRDDDETRRFLEGWRAHDPAGRRTVEVSTPGIVPALIAGTDAVRSPIVAYLDDDAIPQAGWLDELLRGFLDPSVGAVGGRLIDHVNGRPVDGETKTVGRVTWYGRVIGRHGLRTDYYGDVEHLQGPNMAFRRELAHHDERLLHASTGLSLASELDACLTVRRLGYRVLFTPWAVVDHHNTSFRDPRLGSRVAGQDILTSAANYTFALLRFLSPARRIAFRVYAYAVGSASLPGPGRVALELPRHPRRALSMARRVLMTWRGRVEGERMYRRWRSES